MMTLILFIVVLVCFGMLWNEGMWGNAITLINIMIAGMVATNYYEWLAGFFEARLDSSYTYLVDFLAVWTWFVFTFVVLRLISDILTRHKVRFKMPVEQPGRAILALACGWVMACFVSFTLHLAPVNEYAFGGFYDAEALDSPEKGTVDGEDYTKRASLPNEFAGFAAPDRQWMAFVHTRSVGALGRWGEKRQFDPEGLYILKYAARRRALEKHNKLHPGAALRVNP